MASITDLPTTYDEAKQRGERVIANNTRLIDFGSHIALRLHNTDIVRFWVDGRIELRSGGYETVTTKQRLNVVARAHGWNISQSNYRWSIGRRSTDESYEWFGDFIIEPPAGPKPEKVGTHCECGAPYQFLERHNAWGYACAR